MAGVHAAVSLLAHLMQQPALARYPN